MTRVRIELVNVSCGNTEDVTGADEFYIMGALTDGTNTKGVLTTPISINDRQTKTFRDDQRVMFDADVAAGQTVRGGLQAYDEDFAKDWANYSAYVNQIADAVSKGLIASGNPYAVVAGTILKYGAPVFDKIASMDKDDLLGKIELNVAAAGPSVEDLEWRFRRKDVTGYSSWDYTVRYRITRG